MKTSQLKEIIREILNKELALESAASDEAKRQGLEYMSFGRYGKDGKVTHKSQGGKLVPVKSAGTARPGAPATPPRQKAPVKVAPTKNNNVKRIRSTIIDTYDKDEYSDDQYAGVYDMEELVTKRPPKTKRELETLYDKISAYGDKHDMSDDWHSGVYDFIRAYEKTLP
jgi:hypothetical protein